ncbi:MAG: N-acetylmuramoyl-L-alanine amidase [Saprospiraceae bacterium]
MLRFALYSFFLMLAGNAFAAEAMFLKVPALPGDGTISMLRRYELEQYSCNFEQFYKLNKINKKTALQVGKNYFLPILIYTFNGKTIRSSVGINDYDKALRIQQYNERMHEAQMREQSFRASKIIWVPYHELNCPEPDLAVPALVSAVPEAAKTGNRVFPIFGDKYAKTPLMSNRLKGKVFYISSGHGGPDPGALGKRSGRTICEDEYAYDVSLRLCRLLIAHGATAYMVIRDDDGIRDEEILRCDQDETVWGGEKVKLGQKARLFQRSDLVNELYEKHRLQGVVQQTLIEIHVDSRSRGTRVDAFFCYRPSSKEGKRLANNLQLTFQKKYARYQKGRSYQGKVENHRDLHMLREPKPASVFVELANIRNYADQQRLVLPKNRQLLAEWLFEGLTK